MEDNDIISLPEQPHSPTQTPAALRKSRAATTSCVMYPPRPPFLQRLSAFFARLFNRRRMATQATGFACTAQAKAPLVFKGGASVTMANPLGTYAGKPACDPRRLAEQQFHRLDSSHGATIN